MECGVDKDMPHDMRRARSLTRMHMHSVDVHVNCDVWCVVHHARADARAQSPRPEISRIRYSRFHTHTSLSRQSHRCDQTVTIKSPTRGLNSTHRR